MQFLSIVAKLSDPFGWPKTAWDRREASEVARQGLVLRGSSLHSVVVLALVHMRVFWYLLAYTQYV